MDPRPFLFAALMLFSGCIEGGTESGEGSGGRVGVVPFDPPASHPEITFETPQVIDILRSGGEPVVLVTPTGTILIGVHPGYTHLSGPDPGIAAQNGQVHLYRSTDGGDTFAFVGTAGQPAGPRDAVIGISDPDLDYDNGGKVYLSQLYLASTSISWSSDDGATWEGNTMELPPGDRNWVAAGDADIVYHTYRGFDLMKSTDGGDNFVQMASPGVTGNIAVDKRDGTIFVGGEEDSIAVSTDGGESFETRAINASISSRHEVHLLEPAIDAAGAVYMAWIEQDGTVSVVGSPDKGLTWGPTIQVRGEGREAIWPWVAAGDAGRVAVVWLEADENRAWRVESAFVLDALSEDPTVLRATVTGDPVHIGEICSGLGCNVGGSSRALGDFFTADVGPDGLVHVAVGTTNHAPTKGLSHPMYIRQADGPHLSGPLYG